MTEQSTLFRPIFWHSLITKKKMGSAKEGGCKVSHQMPLSDHKWIFGRPLKADFQSMQFSERAETLLFAGENVTLKLIR